MASLEPGQALSVCERALRTLFAHAYRVSFGSDWLNKVTTAPQREKWAERAQGEEPRTKKGVAAVPGAASLDYSEFYELVEIAKRHWEPLSTALGKKAVTVPLLELFERLRNPVGHNRQLFDHEQDLYSGIAGTIRNQVTIYMSSQDEAGEYYPRIDAAWDCFGNVVDTSMNMGELAGSQQTGLILRPGDIVSFTVVATDPQGRQVEWDLHADGSDVERKLVRSGESAKFAWTVSNESVKEHSVAHFYMRVHESPYHRAHGFDQRVYFSYVVRPPHRASGTA